MAVIIVIPQPGEERDAGGRGPGGGPVTWEAGSTLPLLGELLASVCGPAVPSFAACRGLSPWLPGRRGFWASGVPGRAEVCESRELSMQAASSLVMSLGGLASAAPEPDVLHIFWCSHLPGLCSSLCALLYLPRWAGRRRWRTSCVLEPPSPTLCICGMDSCGVLLRTGKGCSFPRAVATV